MNKEQQIEEMRRELYCAISKVSGIACSSDLAEALYNAGYGNVSEYKAERELLGSQIKVLKQRLNNKYIEVDNLNRDYHNSFERLKAQEREIKRLKDENAKLQEQFAKYQLASDKEIVAQVKQAKIEVLNALRERIKTAIDNYFNLDGGGYYLAENAIDDIDDFIEELKK